jgi:hypothetical protein
MECELIHAFCVMLWMLGVRDDIVLEVLYFCITYRKKWQWLPLVTHLYGENRYVAVSTIVLQTCNCYVRWKTYVQLCYFCFIRGCISTTHITPRFLFLTTTFYLLLTAHKLTLCDHKVNWRHYYNVEWFQLSNSTVCFSLCILVSYRDDDSKSDRNMLVINNM